MVIFSEEEARPTVDTNTPSTQSPGGRGQQRIDVGFGFHGGNSQAEGIEGNISKPPASNQQNAPVSDRPTNDMDNTRQLAAPPDGNDLAFRENVDTTWMGYPCPVEEEIPENDSAV